jgi:hypothetical protein
LNKIEPFALLLIFFSSSSHAIVNVEDLRSSGESEGYNTTLDISTNGASGNSDYSVVNAGVRVQYINEANTYLVVSNYANGKSQGKTNVDNSFLHGRHIRSFAADMASELFIQTQQNELALLSSRNLLGGGIRYLLQQDLNETNTHTIYLGAGAFYERERLTKQNLNAVNDDGVRLNFYAVYHFKINKMLRLISTTYYQPSTERGNDFRILEDFSLLSNAGDNLELKLSLNIAHDSKPPSSVEYTDITYNAGFVYHFSNN